MRTRRVIQTILGAMCLIPLLFIAAGIANEPKLGKIRNNGVVVEGRILDGGELPQPKGVKTHYLQVEFEKTTGEREVKTFSVDRDDFVHAKQAGKIPITYVAGRSGISRVGTGFGYDRTPLFVAIAAFLLMAAAIVVIQFVPKGAPDQARMSARKPNPTSP